MADSNKKGPAKGEKIKRYDLAFKKVAMERLILNNMNITQTAKELGVSFKSLNKWRDAHGIALVKETGNVNAEIKERVKFDMLKKESEFTEEVYSVRMQAIEQLKLKVPFVTDTNKLVNIIKLLDDITKGGGTEEETKGTRGSVLQLIQNQLVVNK